MCIGIEWLNKQWRTKSDCTACQCSPLRRKFIGCSINNPALWLLMKHLVTRLSGFHWSAFRDQEGRTFTEKDRNKLNYQSGPNHHLLQLCTVRTAWSASDQSVQAVHSCNSWLLFRTCSICYLKTYHIHSEMLDL